MPPAAGEQAGETPDRVGVRVRGLEWGWNGSLPSRSGIVMPLTIFHHLAIALGLGLLVGLQRQREESEVAGIRTFPLITVLGTLSALLAEQFGGWVVGAGLLGVAAVLVLGNVVSLRQGRIDPGVTTEVAALVMYAVGAALVIGQTAVALVVGGGVAVLLQWKRPLHEFAGRIGQADLKAIFQLVLVALVILPVLPDRAYGPLRVLNPFQIWRLVVLIVGISLGAYLLQRLVGPRGGVVVGGFLGGVISSTATTVGCARQTRGDPGSVPAAAAMIAIAGAVVPVRVLALIAMVGSSSFWRAASLPIALLLAVWLLLAIVQYGLAYRRLTALPVEGDPAQLKAAVAFGVLYALVLLGAAFGREQFGEGGAFAVAVLSGLIDMDAITLSTSQLTEGGYLSESTGWRMIVVASLSNLVFKAAVVALIGHQALAWRVAALFGAGLVGGAAVLVLWPGVG